jgi:hypothetical protein
MNTSFLNWCKVLVGERRRVLMLAQTLCLVAVAAMFLASPFVVLAGCGKQQKQVQPNKQGTLLGTVAGVFKALPPGATLVNGAVPMLGTPGGMVTINPDVSFANLQSGTWVTGTYKGVPFQGTCFNPKQINGNTNVCEMWLADVTQNNLGIHDGQIIPNFVI